MQQLLFSIVVNVSAQEAIEFLQDPAHLHLWTSHQSIHLHQGKWFDVRLEHCVEFKIDFDPTRSELLYRWSWNKEQRDAHFLVTPFSEQQTLIKMKFTVSEDSKNKIELLIQKELKVLKAYLEKNTYEEIEADQRFIREHHLTVYQRSL